MEACRRRHGDEGGLQGCSLFFPTAREVDGGKGVPSTHPSYLTRGRELLVERKRKWKKLEEKGRDCGGGRFRERCLRLVPLSRGRHTEAASSSSSKTSHACATDQRPTEVCPSAEAPLHLA